MQPHPTHIKYTHTCILLANKHYNALHLNPANLYQGSTAEYIKRHDRVKLQTLCVSFPTIIVYMQNLL